MLGLTVSINTCLVAVEASLFAVSFAVELKYQVPSAKPVKFK